MPETKATYPFALGTFSVAGATPFSGLVIDDSVIALEALRPLCKQLGILLPQASDLFELLQDWPTAMDALQAAVSVLNEKTELAGTFLEMFVPVGELKIHPPLDRPRQVLCTGANYFKHVVDIIVAGGTDGTPETAGMSPQALRAHAENLMRERARSGSPYAFSKPAATITGPNDPIVLPPHAEQPDWELELAVVIGKPARHVSREQALEYVAGYTIANDITNRDHIWRTDDMKALGTDWIASKSSPTYLPLGPYIVPAMFIEDPQDLHISLKLNGEVKQDERTSDMIFDVARQIEYLSSMVRLHPGDIICTGSPAGNGIHYKRFLRHGDVIESAISGLGKQRNHCINEHSAGEKKDD